MEKTLLDASLASDLMLANLGHFCSKHIFDRVPFLFDDDPLQYMAWKEQLATGLEIDPRDLLLVGSAAIGKSLDPNGGLREFSDVSDIDVAVISQRHFDLAWRYIRGLGPSSAGLPPLTQAALKEHRTFHVYWGVIKTDKLLEYLPFGRTWAKALGKMTTMDPTKGRDINIRLYHDTDSLRSYQVSGLRKLRANLASLGA